MDDMAKAKAKCMAEISRSVDKLIEEITEIVEAEARSRAVVVQPSSTGNVGGFSLPSLPPALTDNVIRIVWPFIQRLSAEEIIDMKDQIASGQFGFDDIMSIAARGLATPQGVIEHESQPVSHQPASTAGGFTGQPGFLAGGLMAALTSILAGAGALPPPAMGGTGAGTTAAIGGSLAAMVISAMNTAMKKSKEGKDGTQ